ENVTNIGGIDINEYKITVCEDGIYLCHHNGDMLRWNEYTIEQVNEMGKLPMTYKVDKKGIFVCRGYNQPLEAINDDADTTMIANDDFKIVINKDAFVLVDNNSLKLIED